MICAPLPRLRNVRPLPVLCLLCLFCSALCAGCAAPSAAADGLAAAAGLQRVVYVTRDYDIVAYARFTPGSPLTVYIEGDGRAWVTRRRPAMDPSPRPPLALELAAEDPAPSVLYLARPCQFTYGTPHFRSCSVRDWTSARMGPGVLAALNAALDQAKARSGAPRLDLVGYSGGGGVAVLLAARRGDVASLRTVAGNLDSALWTRLHGVSPLSGSLDPRDAAAAVRHIPQVHYVGAEDRNIPVQVAQSFLRACPADRSAIVVVPGCSHSEGWREAWPHLLRDYHK